jgi:hypothetical protein
LGDPGTGLSLTRRDLAGLAVRVGPDRVDLDLDLDLDLVGLVVRVGLADMRGRVGLAVRDRLDPVGLVVRVGLADMWGRVGLAVRDRLDPVGLVVRVGLVGLADMWGRVDLAVRDRRDPVGLVFLDPAGLVDMWGRVGPAVREDLGDRDPAGRVDPADLHRRPTGQVALSTGVVPRWAAPIMRPTASAHPTTARRRHPRNTDSAGTVGLLPERRRLSGTDRRPRVAGAVHRLPVVGTAHGMGRRATSESRRPISGRSITAGITRSRSLTRFSGDGASGSSESGSRCTDTT